MKPLPTYQRVFKLLCLHPVDETTDRWKKVASALFILFTILLDFTLLGGSIAYLLKYLSIDPIQSLYTLNQISPTVVLPNSVICAFLLQHQTAAVFQQLSDIYDSSKQKPFYFRFDFFSNFHYDFIRFRCK